jgi:hypothetical protein
MMRARPAAHNQADLIGSLVRRHGAEVPITDIVRTSWSRCLNNFALDPQETRRPNSVERADLQARRERLGVLLSIARIEMEALGKLIKHSEYSIMLTDRDGVILTYVGDTGFSATARRCGFREGVMWSEREMGTNGMGTCLTARRPVVIHRTDHFLAQNTAASCWRRSISRVPPPTRRVTPWHWSTGRRRTSRTARCSAPPARTCTWCAFTAARSSSAPPARACWRSTTRASSGAPIAPR